MIDKNTPQETLVPLRVHLALLQVKTSEFAVGLAILN